MFFDDSGHSNIYQVVSVTRNVAIDAPVIANGRRCLDSMFRIDVWPFCYDMAGQIHVVVFQHKYFDLHNHISHIIPTSPHPPHTPVVINMAPPGLQLSERPYLERVIKDGKLVMPYNFWFHKQPVKVLYLVYQFTLLL